MMDFFEEDEPVTEVEAAYEQGLKVVTMPPISGMQMLSTAGAGTVGTIHVTPRPVAVGAVISQGLGLRARQGA